MRLTQDITHTQILALTDSSQRLSKNSSKTLQMTYFKSKKVNLNCKNYEKLDELKIS